MKSDSTGNGGPVKVLLDTNVWRYVADAGAWPSLIRAVQSGVFAIQISPSVVYEALRSQNTDVRRRLTSVMSLRTWQRLMPEAYSDSQDILAEIRRLKPGWLRDRPDNEEFARQRYDWTRLKGGFWERVKSNPDQVAKHVGIVDDGVVQRARAAAETQRQQARESTFPESAPLSDIRCRPTFPLSGWRGDDVEVWRFTAWQSITNALQKENGGAYLDWISPNADVTKIMVDDASWVSFWFYEVESKALPRLWLRWAFEFIQGYRRVTDGTPCDAQLATYLPEADVVVSADKVFIQIVEKVRPFAPGPVASPVLVPGGAPGVEALIELLSGSIVRQKRKKE